MGEPIEYTTVNQLVRDGAPHGLTHGQPHGLTMGHPMTCSNLDFPRGAQWGALSHDNHAEGFR